MLETRFQELIGEDKFFAPWRKKYWDLFRSLGSLQEKREAFRYLPLKNLKIPRPAKDDLDKRVFQKKEGAQVTFIDGFFSKEHSSLPKGVICLPVQEAMQSFGVFLKSQMTRSIKEEKDPFSALNGAFQGLGSFLYIPPGLEEKLSLDLQFVSTSKEMMSPRLLIYVGTESEASIHQTYLGETSFLNAHIEVVLDRRSSLSYKQVQKESEGHIFQAFRAFLKKGSILRNYLYSEGADLFRSSITVDLLEEGADALLKGLILTSNTKQSHIHTTVQHKAESAKSYQHFKSLLKDESVTSFEGKIFVESQAQKTDSYQLSNNLLLSEKAKAYAKPNLEVFADDVKASHGATISQVDEESLFYLQSRGLSRESAKELLIESFIQEMKDCL